VRVHAKFRVGHRLWRVRRAAENRGVAIGVAFTPLETRAAVIVRLAARADDLGIARVDVAEGWAHDATILLAEIATRTERIGLGASVLSVWGRSPGTLAMAAAGLQRLSGGRFTLGLGAGSPPLAEGLHGIAWERPVARLRATLVAVRALLDGERLPAPPDGSRALRLGAPPEQRVPLTLAALAPASIRLAGEHADAWTPFLWARSRVDEGRELARTRVSLGVPVALGPSRAEAQQLAAWWLTTYLTRMGPLYPRLLAQRFGMADGVDAVLAGALAAPAAGALAAEVTLLGTYDEAAGRIAEWAAAADDVTLVLPPGRPEEELAALLELAAAAPVAA
jgi:alkanesulfonate monooxygenase SsuD/methylene tetrahydromethanopterin reductase-like flavin-dependent oxidoreductase (luciferase family)